MARGNDILVSMTEKSHHIEGFIAAGETPKPGQIVQIDPTVALKNGRHTWKIYDRAANGDRPYGPLIVLTPDYLQGKTATDAYAAGARAFGYIPMPGDELNMLLADVAGTADAHAIGETLMVQDGTGKLIATTGTPQSNPFILLEALTAPTGDTLAWCMYSGY